MIVKIGRFLWLAFGRDWSVDRRRWAFEAVLFPRLDHTGEGFLIAGRHLTFKLDLVDFDVDTFLVPRSK